MIRALGIDVARGFMTRMGYHAGVHDAQMARKVPLQSTRCATCFVVGPQMHCLGASVSPSRPARVRCGSRPNYGEFIWTSQVEDEEHMRHFSIGDEPACWMQIGYASGFRPSSWGARFCTGRSVPVDGASGVPHRRQAGRRMGRGH